MNVSDPYLVPQANGPVSGSVSLPGSKSYTNRALPIAALAAGTSVITGALDSDDTRHMVNALQALGVDVDADWESGVIRVVGTDGCIPSHQADIFLGNSGTSMRFVAALVAVAHGAFRLDGTPAMRKRPIGPLIGALRDLGVEVREHGDIGCPPIEVIADGLPGGRVTMQGDLSSQYFSALAMVAPYASSPLVIDVEGELVSQPYIDMTAATMAAFGVQLRHENYTSISVSDGDRYVAASYAVEPDASAASYFFALAAVTGGSITVERLSAESLQGDVAFVDVLESMGCSVERNRATITVTGPDQLSGIDVDMNAISDTVMSLAAIAPFANGPVTIRNIGHIRLKETDRLAAIANELGRLGITVDEQPDSITIYPGDIMPATIQTYDDHRMAMSFAITGVKAGGVHIADPGCVSKTVPRFWELLSALVPAR